MKFIIKYDSDYGTEAEVVEADNMEEAEQIAYEAWREAAENNANYSAEEYTQEEAEDYGIEEED